jgi:hypothetical protein
MNIELAQFVLDVQSWDLCPQEFKQKFKEFYMVGLLKNSQRTQFKRGIQLILKSTDASSINIDIIKSRKARYIIT